MTRRRSRTTRNVEGLRDRLLRLIGRTDVTTAGPGRRAARTPARVPVRTMRPRSSRARRQQRYDELVETMCRQHGVEVARWRSSMSGCAWEVVGRGGRVRRLIEAPYPRGPMSCAIFLHEIGHHAIGFHTFRPRCLEEHEAWRWALSAMEANGVTVTERVHRRVAASLAYAVEKARRRGLRRLPVVLVPFIDQPRPDGPVPRVGLDEPPRRERA